MYTNINEPIEVFVNFTTQGTIPIIFTWRNKDYNIETINLTYHEQQGKTTLFHFMVSSKTENYKLTFNSTALKWALTEVYSNTKHLNASSLNDAYVNVTTIASKTKVYTAYRLR